jgi:hypothetical protein
VVSGVVVLDAKNVPLQVGSVVERRSTTERLGLAVISDPHDGLLGLVLARNGVAAATVWAEEMMNGKFRALDLIAVPSTSNREDRG